MYEKVCVSRSMWNTSVVIERKSHPRYDKSFPWPAYKYTSNNMLMEMLNMDRI